jgi:hypothetical protein
MAVSLLTRESKDNFDDTFNKVISTLDEKFKDNINYPRLRNRLLSKKDDIYNIYKHKFEKK